MNGLTSFEQFLISKGYERFEIVKDGNEWVYRKKKFYGYSSMGCVWSMYIKKGLVTDGQTAESKGKNTILAPAPITFGLHEKGKPPTLIAPRPRIQLIKRDGDRVYILDEQFDDMMNRVLDEFSNEEIFEAMYNGKTITLT